MTYPGQNLEILKNKFAFWCFVTLLSCSCHVGVSFLLFFVSWIWHVSVFFCNVLSLLCAANARLSYENEIFRLCRKCQAPKKGKWRKDCQINNRECQEITKHRENVHVRCWTCSDALPFLRKLQRNNNPNNKKRQRKWQKTDSPGAK